MLPSKDFPKAADPNGIEHSAWSHVRVTKRLNMEMLVLLRMHLSSDFKSSNSWEGLRQRLHKKGFYLCLGAKGLRLKDSHSHVDICGSRDLGYPRKLLEGLFKTPVPQTH